MIIFFFLTNKLDRITLKIQRIQTISLDQYSESTLITSKDTLSFVRTGQQISHILEQQKRA
jgi:hypothetical protein